MYAQICADGNYFWTSRMHSKYLNPGGHNFEYATSINIIQPYHSHIRSNCLRYPSLVRVVWRRSMHLSLCRFAAGFVSSQCRVSDLDPIPSLPYWTDAATLGPGQGTCNVMSTTSVQQQYGTMRFCIVLLSLAILLQLPPPGVVAV